MKTEVKICGFTRRGDVLEAIRLGVDYVGFVVHEASKRYVAPEDLPALTRDLPSGIRKVGVFVDRPAAEILEIAARGKLDIVQLHGKESAETAREIGRFLPVWKAFALGCLADLDPALDFPAARIVVDSPGGGSGVCCDWNLARLLARRRPIMLAGGITPENAALAIRQAAPVGIDLAGGVESAYGIKSREKMERLMKEIER